MTHPFRVLSRLTLTIALVALTSACALSVHSLKIADLRSHPARYNDQSVSVTGVVTTSWGVPLVPFKFYKVDDGTGEVTVLSDHARMPARGERVRVKGRVSDLAVIGGRSLGLHLREEALQVKR